MKRANNLFESIIDYQNIRLAFLKAIRGNRTSTEAIYFCTNTDNNLAVIQKKLTHLNADWGRYRSFLINDPKPREISVAPFEQRIMHHAIMNILAPVFERSLIYHSYACRKGKGTHAAVLYAFGQCKRGGYFLKLDIRKYFDSIDHDVLKCCIARFIKDVRTLFLLNAIIDSYEKSEKTPGRGIPIGNLTSQFFANLYLSSLDHYILEHLRPTGYCRYMDDFVLWHTSKETIQKMLVDIDRYVEGNLHLCLKNPVYGRVKDGLPFLGFLIKENGIFLTQKSKQRVVERISKIDKAFVEGEITEEKASERALSAFAAIKLARTHNLRRRITENIG
jgi:retron-type reverse transcriptase